MGRYYNSERIGEAANDIDETDNHIFLLLNIL